MHPNQMSPMPTYGRTHAASPRPFAVGPMPPTNTGWAVVALLFFWPLAFSAFSHSSKVTALWMSGDATGAQYSSDQVKKMGKIALLVWGICTALLVIFYGVAVVYAISSGAAGSSGPRY
jgi:hypothetical protein